MANPIRIKAIQGLRKGDSFSYTREFTREETLSFGDMTRDYNPVHYDLRWAEIKGFKDSICHGLLVGSMLCEFGGQVGWLATGMSFKFIKPVYFGDRIRCAVTITKIADNGRAEAEAFFTNQDEEKVCRAHLTGRVPLNPEQGLLKQMIDEGDPDNKLSHENYSGIKKAIS
jgi:acyl dehydratase